MLYTAAANKHPLISIGYASKGAHFFSVVVKILKMPLCGFLQKILEGPPSGIL